MKKFIPSKVTPEECTQMVAMMNYFDSDPEVMNYQIRSYKQFNSNDQHYHTMFCLIVMKWVNGKHKTYMVDDNTLIGTMGKLVQKMQEKEAQGE
jgi:hypothetical protein